MLLYKETDEQYYMRACPVDCVAIHHFSKRGLKNSVYRLQGRIYRHTPAILPIRIQVRKKNLCTFNRGRPPPFGFPTRTREAKQPSAHDALIVASSAVTHRVSSVSIHGTDRVKALFLKLLTQTASRTRTIISSRLYTRRRN